jgi:hypothetical protein
LRSTAAVVILFLGIPTGTIGVEVQVEECQAGAAASSCQPASEALGQEVTNDAALSMLQGLVKRKANHTHQDKANTMCVGRGDTCGYNGNPWCDVNPSNCCCGGGYCSPELGNLVGVITMRCSTSRTCRFPTPNPADSLCGAGGKQQIPCCGSAQCVPLLGSTTPGGGLMMVCVNSAPSPTPPPAPAPPQCANWNQPCDFTNTCCSGYECTWANTSPQPSTICLGPTDQTGPPGQCVDWNQDCDYNNRCCSGLKCTWANFNPPRTVCLR